MKGIIYLPKGIDSKLRTAVKKRAAEEFGGFTMFEASGGWVNERGELIEETVDVLEIAGADETFVRSTAEWLSNRSNETEVMWETIPNSYGFE
jgi:hypothetical protein